jgi:hypothetical protein
MITGAIYVLVALVHNLTFSTVWLHNLLIGYYYTIFDFITELSITNEIFDITLCLCNRQTLTNEIFEITLCVTFFKQEKTPISRLGANLCATKAVGQPRLYWCGSRAG